MILKQTSTVARIFQVENNVCRNAAITKDKPQMLEQEDVPDLVLDLEQRIDMMQNMGDSELGTFNHLDWIILIIFAIVIPVIAMVAAR